jgi:hypothetical protein
MIPGCQTLARGRTVRFGRTLYDLVIGTKRGQSHRLRDGVVEEVERRLAGEANCGRWLSGCVVGMELRRPAWAQGGRRNFREAESAMLDWISGSLERVLSRRVILPVCGPWTEAAVSHSPVPKSEGAPARHVEQLSVISGQLPRDGAGFVVVRCGWVGRPGLAHGITGLQTRGTGGTRFWIRVGPQDRGHPPVGVLPQPRRPVAGDPDSGEEGSALPFDPGGASN